MTLRRPETRSSRISNPAVLVLQRAVPAPLNPGAPVRMEDQPVRRLPGEPPRHGVAWLSRPARRVPGRITGRADRLEGVVRGAITVRSVAALRPRRSGRVVGARRPDRRTGRLPTGTAGRCGWSTTRCWEDHPPVCWNHTRVGRSRTIRENTTLASNGPGDPIGYGNI